MAIALSAEVITQSFRLATAAFGMAFLVFVLQRYRALPTSPLRTVWLVYWTTFAAQYLTSYFSTQYNLRESYGSYLGVVICDVVQSTALVVIAQSLAPSMSAPSRGTPQGLQNSVLWVLPVAMLITGLALENPMGQARAFAQLTFGFLAVSWFAARWVAMTAPARRMYFAFPMLLYAADYFSPLGIDSTEVGQAAMSVVKLVLYASLAYACHHSLRHAESYGVGEWSVPSAPILEDSIQVSTKGSAALEPPDPQVIVHLENFFGFIYLLWRYPSGKGVLAALVAVIFTVVLALIEALSKLP
jgi:hypothetical protein